MHDRNSLAVEIYVTSKLGITSAVYLTHPACTDSKT